MLGQLGDAQAEEPLILALKDSSSSVRGAAALGLGGLKSPRAVSELTGKVRDEAPDVRSAVAAALGDLRDKRAVDPLIQLLKDEYKMVKISAALALADIGDKRALDALNQAARNPRVNGLYRMQRRRDQILFERAIPEGLRQEYAEFREILPERVTIDASGPLNRNGRLHFPNEQDLLRQHVLVDAGIAQQSVIA